MSWVSLYTAFRALKRTSRPVTGIIEEEDRRLFQKSLLNRLDAYMKRLNLLPEGYIYRVCF